MTFTFSNNPIDKLICRFYNWRERYTHKVWNKKRHNVRCLICGEYLDSTINKDSPEECGWEHFRGWMWICHRCWGHRNFKPYIKLIDSDMLIEYFRKNDPNLDRSKIVEERDKEIRKICKNR